MSDKESLEAKRHQLYCSIADSLKHTSAENSSGILGRLQAVLEAEASLSCIDGDEGESVLLEPASNTFSNSMIGSAAAGQAAAATWHTHGPTPHQSFELTAAAPPRPTDQARSAQRFGRPTTSGLAMSALHDLKEELAQCLQKQKHSMQKQRRCQGNVSSAAGGLYRHFLYCSTQGVAMIDDMQDCLITSSKLKFVGLFSLCYLCALHDRRPGAHLHAVQFMSCSSLLSDLRAAQQQKAALEEQLHTAHTAAATQRKQHEQEVSHTDTHTHSQDAIALPSAQHPWPSSLPAHPATCTSNVPWATL
jgi:hypothetical protein